MTNRPQRGFTYLWLLFAVALSGAVLAQIGQHWSGLVQRERERELIFRGQQIAAAIAAYHAAPGVAAAAWPRGFDELLEDRRAAAPQRHLRQAFSDPLTGKADWVPVLDEGGGWRGVHSRSDAPASIRFGLEFRGQGPNRTKVSDHRFVAPPKPAASAAQAAASSADAPQANPELDGSK
jgi:type II secretory pathway pseudopilin PulG